MNKKEKSDKVKKDSNDQEKNQNTNLFEISSPNSPDEIIQTDINYFGAQSSFDQVNVEDDELPNIVIGTASENEQLAKNKSQNKQQTNEQQQNANQSSDTPSDMQDDSNLEENQEMPKQKPKRNKRGKVKVEFIENPHKRRITFSKRKARFANRFSFFPFDVSSLLNYFPPFFSVMKKAYELATLTGLNNIIIFLNFSDFLLNCKNMLLTSHYKKNKIKALKSSCLLHQMMDTSIPS